MNFAFNEWNKQGLKYNPFHTIVAPRPIGWASTLSNEGELNLSPFAYFNAINTDPEQVMLSISNRGHMHKEKFGFEINSLKDTLKNILDTKEFVINLVTKELVDAMNKSSENYTPEINEFAQSGVTPEPSMVVKPPRVKETPIALECKLWKSITLPQDGDVGTTMVIGTVVNTYINDDMVVDGVLDMKKTTTIGRLGGRDYCYVNGENTFQLTRPDNYTKGAW